MASLSTEDMENDDGGGNRIISCDKTNKDDNDVNMSPKESQKAIQILNGKSHLKMQKSFAQISSML